MGEFMREIYTFYFKLGNGETDSVKFKAISMDAALYEWYSYVAKNKLDVIDFDHESEPIEEEREL